MTFVIAAAQLSTLQIMLLSDGAQYAACFNEYINLDQFFVSICGSMERDKTVFYLANFARRFRGLHSIIIIYI